jgi:hypothetical protein
MDADRVIGDGGNLTVYERTDGSRYALDKKGHGEEWEATALLFGRARFDSRMLATGHWKNSHSSLQHGEGSAQTPRARLHSRTSRTLTNGDRSR